MADKELRRMSRTELIEIIYALQQNERTLRDEQERLSSQLQEKNIRIERAGSIAEAALGLNRIFEDAQAAADQYLVSVRDAHPSREESAPPRPEADGAEETKFSEAFGMEADRTFAAAGTMEKEAAEQLREVWDLQRLCEQEWQAFQKERDGFLRESAAVLRRNPELAARMRKSEGRKSGG